MTWETLRRLGRESADAHRSTLADRVASTRPTTSRRSCYTSGTTGPPKGVVQTHGNHIAAVSASKQATPVEEAWVHLLFLPLAHSVRAARIVPRRRARAHHGVRGEPGQGRRESARGARRTSSAACRACSRRSTARILTGVEAGSPRQAEDLQLGRGGRTRREPPSAARPARARRARARAQDRPQARLLEAPRGRSAAGCAGPCPAAPRSRATSPSSSTRRASCCSRATGSPRPVRSSRSTGRTAYKFGSVGQAAARSRAQDRRRRRDPARAAEHRDARLLQAARGDARGLRADGLVPHRGHRDGRRGRASCSSPIERRTSS